MSRRKLPFLLVAFIGMLFCTGCLRLVVETGGRLHYPPKRYFVGSRALGYFARKMGPASIPYYIVMEPFELCADLLMLPYDCALHINYSVHPPLNEYILRNDLKGLAKKLDNGADPNFIDNRYRKPNLPLLDAYSQKKQKAFNLLLEHHAVIPLTLFKNGNSHAHNLMLKDALATGRFDKAKCNSRAASSIIYDWLKYLEFCSPGKEEETYALRTELLSILLGYGFPVNGIVTTNHWQQETALDYLLRISAKMNKPEEKSMIEKLISLLRSYGGKTFAELYPDAEVHLPPEVSQEEIPSVFQPFVNYLATAPDSSVLENCRFSTSYPGIPSPVLVLDYCYPNNKNLCRRKIQIHRRQSPTRWNQEGDFFEVPYVMRLVLTPAGVRVPSRLDEDLPTKDILIEEWHSLPEFEVYIENAPMLLDSVNYSFEKAIGDFLGISDYPMQKGKMRDGDYLYDPINGFDEKNKYDFNTKVSERLLSKGEEKLPSHIYKWYRGAGGHFYSSHRDLYYLDAASDHRVPFPDEIFVYAGGIAAMDQSSDSDSKEHYWNYKVYKFPGVKRFVRIYHGDEVDPKEMDNLLQQAKRLLKK